MSESGSQIREGSNTLTVKGTLRSQSDNIASLLRFSCPEPVLLAPWHPHRHFQHPPHSRLTVKICTCVSDLILTLIRRSISQYSHFIVVKTEAWEGKLSAQSCSVSTRLSLWHSLSLGLSERQCFRSIETPFLSPLSISLSLLWKQLFSCFLERILQIWCWPSLLQADRTSLFLPHWHQSLNKPRGRDGRLGREVDFTCEWYSGFPNHFFRIQILS